MSQILNIEINSQSRIPKYKQIVDSVINDISKGNLQVGEKIPSINELSEYLLLSRDTVEKAYKLLKEKKIIVSVKGKGYYTAKTDLISKVNVFFFVNTIGVNGHVNLFIYHCDEILFKRSLERNIGAYDYYVIMPHFRDENSNHVSYTDEVLKLMEQIPKDQLILLDNTKPHIKGDYGSIYQDFQKDIYNALQEGIEKIKKYDKIILVYPRKSVNPYPR